MGEGKPDNRNIKTTIINGRYVSSAEIWRFFGAWMASYETFVWEIDDETNMRGELLYQTYQNTEKEALRVHGHFVNNFEKEAD